MANTKVIELLLVAKNLMGDGVDDANKDVQSLQKSIDELSKSTDTNNKRNNESQTDFEKRTKRTIDALEKQIKTVEKSQGVERRAIGLSKEQEKAIKERDRAIVNLGKKEEKLQAESEKRLANLQKEIDAEAKLLKAQQKRVTFRKNNETGVHESTGDENIVIRDMGKERTNRYVAENTITGKRKRGTKTLNQAKLAAQELSAATFEPQLKALRSKISDLENDLYSVNHDITRTQNRRLELEYDAQTYLSDQAQAYERAVANEEKLQKIQQDGELRKESKELLSYRKRKLELDKLDTDLNGRLVALRRKKLELEKLGVGPDDPVLRRVVGDIRETKQERDELGQRRKRLKDDKAHVQYLEAERNAITDINLAHEEALDINKRIDKEEAAAKKRRDKERDVRFNAQIKFHNDVYKEAHRLNDKIDKEEKDRIEGLIKGESDLAKKRRQLFQAQGDEAGLRLDRSSPENNLKLEENIAKQKLLREEIEKLGGSYDDLTTKKVQHYHRTAALEKIQTEAIIKNARVTAKANREKAKAEAATKKVVKVEKEHDFSLRNLAIRFREVGRAGGELTRRLGRLGLAMRGLIIVTVLVFLRSFVATISALVGGLISLAGSLVYAAGALGGTFVGAVAQALPVVGLLMAAFQRLAAIQEAVNQAGLLEKQQFGDDGGPAQEIVDNTDAIADANRALKEAQEGVTEARKEAREELQELIYKEREAELALRGSVLSQAEAQRALREAIREGDTEGIAQAQLSVDSSRFDTGQSRRSLRDIRKERKQGQRGGVDSRDNVKDAIDGVADAQRNLADAHKQATTAATTQIAAERNLGFALSDLSSAEKRLFRQITEFKERFAEAARPITDILINSFSRAFSSVEELLFNPRILGGFTKLARVLGTQIEKIADVLTGAGFTDFFVHTMDQSAKNVPIVANAFIVLAKIFANIAKASAPVLHELLKLIVGELRVFEETTSKTNKMTSFFEDGLEHLRAWWRLLKSIGGLFGELMGASGDSGLDMLTRLTDTINGAKDALSDDDSGARSYFEDAAEGMRHIGTVIVSLGKAFVNLSGSNHVKALADIFNKVLIPGLEQGIRMVGIFALALDVLVEIPVISDIMKWTVAFAVFGAALSSMMGLFKPFYIFFKHFFQILGKVTKLKPVAGFFKNLRIEFGFLKILLSKGGIAGGLRVFSKALAGIPIVGWIVVAAIELILGAFDALKENFLGITDIIKDNFGGIVDEVKAIGGDIAKAFGGIGEIFGGNGSGTETDLRKFLNILVDIGKATFTVIGFIGKLAASVALLAIVNAVLVPLRFLLRVIRAITKAIADWIQNFADLINGEISFGEFLKNIGKITLTFLWDILKAAGGLVWDFLKNIGKFMWNALRGGLESVFEGVGNTVVNAMLDVLLFAIDKINWVIGKINDVSPFGNIEDIDTDAIQDFRNNRNNVENGKLTQSTPVEGYLDSIRGGKGKAGKDDEDDAKAKDKRAKATKKATDFSLRDFKVVGRSNKETRRSARLNNQMADALRGSSRAHKRAQNIQEALGKAANRNARRQKNYADSIRDTAKAENRLVSVLRRTKKFRNESNDSDKRSIRIRDDLSDASRIVARMQSRFNDATNNGTKIQDKYNERIIDATGGHKKYKSAMASTTKQTGLEAAAVSGLSRKLGALNSVLKTTGENSRALGMVFKEVTNKILTEFNVKPLKVELPAVAGMFKNTMSESQNFAAGGYFGRKGERKPDDRMVKVGGGEAFLTGAQQREADKAFAVANAVGASPYNSLDTLFAKETRAHAGTGYGGKSAFNRGGRNSRRASAGGRSIVIPQSVPDADGALPGLDLVAWLANKYFGLSTTSGLRVGDDGDHGWGGAVDLSNGSSPTPQMDSAWQWFADTLGTGGAWTENYSGGAISQMLYRTMIGGNHFNHIHIALQDQYARNTEALTKILTGKAIPVAGGGMIAAAVPKIKKPKIKGDKGIPRKTLQAQSDKFTGAANKYLEDNIQIAAPGMANLNIPSYSEYKGKLNKSFPEGSNITIAPWQAAMLAEKAGMPGVTFAQIAKGESGFRPGAVGDDAAAGYGNTFGLGLWQITTGVGHDDMIAQMGGKEAMFNPWINALAARKLWEGAGRSITPWYGTSFVTGDNLHYDGHKNLGLARGGKVPAFDDGGIVPGRIGEPRMILAHGGEEIIPSHDPKKLTDYYRKKDNDKGKSKSAKSSADKQIDRIRKMISKTQDRIQDAEKKSVIRRLKERLDRFRDDILTVKARDEFTDEIKEKNKEIREKEKELQKASGKEKKKSISKEIKELERELKGIKDDRASVKVFEGAQYNTSDIQDFMLLTTDRIAAFIRDIEETVADLALATSRWTYKIRKNRQGKKVVSRIHTAQRESQRALSDLNNEFREIIQALNETRRQTKSTKKRIRKEIRESNREINKVKRNIRQTDDKDERETYKKELEKLRGTRKDDLEKLRTSLNNIDNQRKDLQGRRAENIAARYEAQLAIYDEKMSRFDQRLTKKDTQASIAELRNQGEDGELTEAGKKRITEIYQDRGDILGEQRKTIQRELRNARRTGDKERTRELEQALLDNQLAQLENTQSIDDLNNVIEESKEIYEKLISSLENTISQLDVRVQIATLQNQDEEGNLTDLGKLIVAGLYIEIEAVLRQQQKAIQDQLAEAIKLGDTESIEDLELALLNNELAIINNTNSIKDLNYSNIEAYDRRISSLNAEIQQLDTRAEIEALKNQDDDDELTEEGRAIIEALYNERGGILQQERQAIQEELDRARSLNQIDRSKELEQALLDNELALLQNTQSIEDLEDEVGDVFDFQSTNWQMFRQAVLTGNREVLPQFASVIPQLATGGYIKREGVAYLHAGETVVPASKTGNSGALIDTINFTQPMEVADPVALSNQIGFKISTLKSV